MEGIERFFTQSYISFKALFGWLEPKSYIFIKIIAPIFQLIFFCLLAKFCYGAENLAPYVVGNALLLCTSNCIFGLGNVFIADRYYGTIKSIMTMPTSKFPLFLQRGFPHAVDSLTSVIIGGAIGSIVFGINYKGVNMWLMLCVLLVAMFAASSFGLLIGVCSLMTSEMHMLLNLAEMSLIALCGANFPIEQLPLLLRYISFCLPLTRSISASKIILSGGTFNDVRSLIFGEILIGVIFIIAGYLFLTATERFAKKKATLDFY